MGIAYNYYTINQIKKQYLFVLEADSLAIIFKKTHSVQNAKSVIHEKKKCNFKGLGTFPHLRSSDKKFSVLDEKRKLFIIKI